MDVNIDLEPIQLVIFGAGGNLTWRKLMPVLYNLFLGEWLPDRFAVIGVDRKAMSDIEFRQHLHQGGDRFSRCGNADDEAWHAFRRMLLTRQHMPRWPIGSLLRTKRGIWRPIASSISRHRRR
jgi:glucose-6-phosphate 1-dehydrogenase